ncbi:MAG TPA: AsmA family protein, partial [Chromatiaceae bacterium]|nr:AsmA family protein [Chromatiaceae bacterium]
SLDLSQTQGPDRHPALRFDLALNRLDLGATSGTRTVPTPAAPAPPPGPAPDPTPGQALPQVQPVSPPDSARRHGLDLNGTLSIQSLRLAGLRLEQVSVQVRGKEGDLSLDHRVAAFYGGGLAGTLRLDLRGQDPQIELTAEALDFQAEPLLMDLTGAAALSGRGDLRLKLASTGRTRDGLVRGLGGNLALRLHHGALQGLDLSTLAGVGGAPTLVGQAPNLASFDELSASAALTQGILRSDDLVATGPWMRLTGGGTLDLVDGRLDWRLTPILQAPPQGGGIRELEGIPIPVQLGGTLGEPTWRVDSAAVLREVTRRRLQDRQGRGGFMEQIERRTGIRGLDGVLRGLLGP